MAVPALAKKPDGTEEAGRNILSAPFFDAYSSLCKNCAPAHMEALLDFMARAQQAYQSLYFLSPEGRRLTAAEAGLSESAFAFSLIAFANVRESAVVLPPQHQQAYKGAVFSGERFIVYDMDQPQMDGHKELVPRVFMVNSKTWQIEAASCSIHFQGSDFNHDGVMDKVGETGQASPYGIMALIGEYRKDYCYLFGQEKGINSLIGATIPKRLHTVADVTAAIGDYDFSQGCIIIDKEAYGIVKQKSGNFGAKCAAGQPPQAIMVYAHFTGKHSHNATEARHGRVPDFTAFYLGKSSRMGMGKAVSFFPE